MIDEHDLDREIEAGLAPADEMLCRQKKHQWFYVFLWLGTLTGIFFNVLVSVPVI
jgi:hypothetical protein